MQHVAIGDDVFLAFQPQLAAIAGAGFAIQPDIVVIGDGFGANEPLFEIGVNDGGRLRRLGTARNRPGTRFLRTNSEIGDQMQQRVAGTDQTIETRLFEAERIEKFCALFA